MSEVVRVKWYLPNLMDSNNETVGLVESKGGLFSLYQIKVLDTISHSFLPDKLVNRGPDK